MHSLLNQLAERREEKERNARELEEIKTLTQSSLLIIYERSSLAEWNGIGCYHNDFLL